VHRKTSLPLKLGGAEKIGGERQRRVIFGNIAYHLAAEAGRPWFVVPTAAAVFG
jgi:hypothetical protein